MTAPWWNAHTWWQVSCFYFLFLDVAAEPQKWSDVSEVMHCVVGLGNKGPLVESLSCKMLSLLEAVPLGPGIIMSPLMPPCPSVCVYPISLCVCSWWLLISEVVMFLHCAPLLEPEL